MQRTRREIAEVAEKHLRLGTLSQERLYRKEREKNLAKEAKKIPSPPRVMT